MKKKIIEIIGFGIEPERAELMADQIMELIELWAGCNACTAYPDFNRTKTPICDICDDNPSIIKL
jgi:hypothetical protein